MMSLLVFTSLAAVQALTANSESVEASALVSRNSGRSSGQTATEEAHLGDGRHKVSGLAEVISRAAEVADQHNVRSGDLLAMAAASKTDNVAKVPQAVGEVRPPWAPAKPANIFNKDLKNTESSKAGSTRKADREGAKGNPLVWTMGVAYGGLTVLVIMLFVVWSDSGGRRLAEGKSKPATAVQGRYNKYVL
mmetsp:Transcript_102233/g.202976  ORF Transcript_102233/g.202976 Transcript_102233/m.202976 type:complete len:192 (+) Transcript_102233:116-691(+)